VPLATFAFAVPRGIRACFVLLPLAVLTRGLIHASGIRSGRRIAPRCVAGIGFTVALLVGDLSYGETSAAHTDVKIGVLTGSLAAAVLGGTILGIRSRHYERQATG
jgi:NhaA family Na+:H+ antiporter